jgi:hypothetical protein
MRILSLALVLAGAFPLAAGPMSSVTLAGDRPPGVVWVIESSSVAPWADPAQTLALDEPRRLIGKAVTFGPKAVQAPAPIGCANPKYAARQDGPDLLFQGALAEPDKDGKARDAAALARRLGMNATTVATYEIGCSEFEFHALRPGTLSFALNDRIYTMRPFNQLKQAGPAAKKNVTP